jgi:plasmid stability protein
MALVVELDPNLEETLRAQARSQGLSLEEYARNILEQQSSMETQPAKLTAEEFEAELDAIAAYSDKIPDLPTEAFTRESICQDHD